MKTEHFLAVQLIEYALATEKLEDKVRFAVIAVALARWELAKNARFIELCKQNERAFTGYVVDDPEARKIIRRFHEAHAAGTPMQEVVAEVLSTEVLDALLKPKTE